MLFKIRLNFRIFVRFFAVYQLRAFDYVREIRGNKPALERC